VAVSQAVVNGLVLSFAALLTLLLAASLIVVMRLPSWPALDPTAKQELGTRNARFEAELRKRARARAGPRGKEVSKKDIRAEYRELRIRKTPRGLQRVTRYGGVTISGAGLTIAVPSLPHFPSLSPGVGKVLSGAGIIVAATAMVFDSSEFLRDMVERRRNSKNGSGALVKEHDRSRNTSVESPVEDISESAEKELRRCCERLAKAVEKEARRRAGETEITDRDIEEAWEKLVRPYESGEPAEPAERAIGAPRSRRESILLGLTTLAAIIILAGILYLIFSLVKPRLPAGQYWPAIAILATLFILYLVLVNIRSAMVAVWSVVGAIFGTLASWVAGGLSWLTRKDSALMVSLFRIRRRDSDQAILRSRPRIRTNAGKERPATDENTSEPGHHISTTAHREDLSGDSEMRVLRQSGTSGAATSDDERKWPWPNREGLREAWAGQLDDTKEDYKRRLIWVDELLARSFRVLDKRDQAAKGTEASHWFQRGSAGASAAVATLTGGTLIGSIHGTAATVIGIGAVLVGLFAAVIVAVKPEQSYATDLAQKGQYEQLWWDMRSYAVTQLLTADENSFAAAINAFAKREADIMGSAAPTAPT
jgi:hypothetical protein